MNNRHAPGVGLLLTHMTSSRVPFARARLHPRSSLVVVAAEIRAREHDRQVPWKFPFPMKNPVYPRLMIANTDFFS